MKKALFQELLESVREGGEIMRGAKAPSRSFAVGEPDVREVRDRFALSQPKFAALMGISVGTLRNWEQGRRQPEGSAKVLLRVVSMHPEAVLESVAGAPNHSLHRTRLGRRATETLVGRAGELKIR
jgi:putative transcriptional regulator